MLQKLPAHAQSQQLGRSKGQLDEQFDPLQLLEPSPDLTVGYKDQWIQRPRRGSGH